MRARLKKLKWALRLALAECEGIQFAPREHGAGAANLEELLADVDDTALELRKKLLIVHDILNA